MVSPMQYTNSQGSGYSSINPIQPLRYLGQGHSVTRMNSATFAELPRIHQAFYCAINHDIVDFSEVYKYLQEGDDVNAKGLRGKTLLHEAVWHMKFAYPLAQRLLDHPFIKISDFDDTGHTPLFLAVSSSSHRGNRQIALNLERMLILRGANPDLAENRQISAFNYAQRLDILLTLPRRWEIGLPRQAVVMSRAKKERVERTKVLQRLNQKRKIDLARKYFHGRMTHKQALRRIQHQEEGTYFTYIDANAISGFLNLYLIFQGNDGYTRKCLVEWNPYQNGYVYCNKSYPSIDAIIKGNQDIYRKPFHWYNG
ncbi:MAG: hypothetical protein H7A37_06885 [Chlamydiales bacterium]|nr:hypothetical protein [Chlamydiales bacterium]